MGCRVNDAERAAHLTREVIVTARFEQSRGRVADYHRGPNTCDELFRLLPVLRTLQIEVAAPEGLPGDPRADLVEERVEKASIRTMDRAVELVSDLPHIA